MVTLMLLDMVNREKYIFQIIGQNDKSKKSTIIVMTTHGIARRLNSLNLYRVIVESFDDWF